MAARYFRLALMMLVCSASDLVSASHQIQTAAQVPQFERFGPLKTLGAWQLPEGSITKVMMMLASTTITPYDYWPLSRDCPECRGLPENSKLVIDAIAMNYAVFVPETITPLPLCWDSWPADNPEIENLLAIFSEWKHAHGLENLPNVGLGTSCGGKILSTLGLRTGLFESLAIMICVDTEPYAAVTHEYPPTIFIHMPKDSAKAEGISSAMKFLHSKGVLTSEVKWYEHPVTPDWFSQSIPVVDLALSNAIYEALREDGWLADGSDLLKFDVYNDDWTNIVTRWNVLPQNPGSIDLTLLEDSILQELNVAYAFHVTLARANKEMFSWFEGGYNESKIGLQVEHFNRAQEM